MVGKEIRKSLATAMKKTGGLNLSQEQEKMFGTIDDLINYQGSSWKELHSPSEEVKMWVKHHVPKEEGGTTSIGKAEGFADTTASEVSAWFMNYCNYGHTFTRKSRADGRRRSTVHEVRRDDILTPQNEKIFSSIISFSKALMPLSDRKFVTKYAWRTSHDNSTMSIYFWPGSELDDPFDFSGASSGTVNGTSMGLLTATNISCTSGSMAQCSVTYHECIDLRGFVPRSLVVHSIIPRRLMTLQQEIANNFCRDKEADDAKLNALIRVLKENVQEYSASEKELLGRVSYDTSLIINRQSSTNRQRPLC